MTTFTATLVMLGLSWWFCEGGMRATRGAPEMSPATQGASPPRLLPGFRPNGDPWVLSRQALPAQTSVIDVEDGCVYIIASPGARRARPVRRSRVRSVTGEEG